MGKERPILFSGEMVRAILEGRKTQTRRVIRNARGEFWDHAGYRPVLHESGSWVFEDIDDPTRRVFGPRLRCPYGLVGDRLWVREAWAPGVWLNQYDDLDPGYRASWAQMARNTNFMEPRWRPSIHMPRWASRITLEIVGVRVERVNLISRADCVAEGLHPTKRNDSEQDIRMRYRELWNSINARRGYAWATNPWVWVVEFRRV